VAPVANSHPIGTPEKMCGVCNTAWDIIMGRARPFNATHTAWHWLLKCKYGGCDPECWDYVADDGTVIGRPPYSQRLYHRRDSSVPWNMQTRVRRVVPMEELVAADVEKAKKKKALEKAFDEPAPPAEKYAYDF